MGNFLATLPKNLLAILAIAGGTIFIIFFVQPPHSLCDSQLEVINKSQASFLFENEVSKRKLAGKKEGPLTTKFQRLSDQCNLTNDPGGCYELFQEMRVLLRDLNTVTKECNAAVGEVTVYKRAVRETLDKMVRIAWGSAPPASYNVKFNWLDASDLNLFCRLKDRYIAFYGEDSWEDFRKELNAKLPGSKDLTPNQIWDLSIFSENCARHP